MILAKVVGNVVATKKCDLLTGKKLMLVSPYVDGSYQFRNLQVATDSVGAGIGETVLLAVGSAARKDDDDTEKPIDMKIVGIVDEIDLCGEDMVSCELV